MRTGLSAPHSPAPSIHMAKREVSCGVKHPGSGRSEKGLKEEGNSRHPIMSSRGAAAPKSERAGSSARQKRVQAQELQWGSSASASATKEDSRAASSLLASNSARLWWCSGKALTHIKPRGGGAENDGGRSTSRKKLGNRRWSRRAACAQPKLGAAKDPPPRFVTRILATETQWPSSDQLNACAGCQLARP